MIRKATLIVALSAALLAPLVATAPSTAAARQAVEVALTSISPDYTTDANAEIKFSGTISNTTATPMSGLTIRLRYSQSKFPDRTALRTYLTGPPVQLSVSSSSQLTNQAVASNGSTPWEITRTPAQLGLRSPGVYPVAVEVAVGGWQVIATQRSVITYFPSTPGQPKPPKTKLAVALPVIDQPHRSDDGLFVDDKLSEALGPKGTLTNLARIAKTAPKSVTWFVNPSLPDDLAAMSGKNPYKVKDSPQDKPPNPAASQWLDSMRASLATAPVAALPYADPDVAALAHQGLDALTNRAIALGGQKVRQLLKRDDVVSTMGWPVDGAIDEDGLDLLAMGGVRSVLLNPTSLPPQQPVTFTPDAAATLDTVSGPVTALLSDAELSRMFEFDPSAPSTTALNKQRFVAETAMISMEQGQTRSRSVVVAPSRRWNPNPTLVSTLLKTANKLPWLRLTPLGSIKPGKVQVPRAGLTYTEQDRKDELGPKYMASVKKAADDAMLTSQITSDKGPSAYDAAVLRAASSAWRNTTRAGRGLTKQVQGAVTKTMGQIQITGADRPRTLAGSDGQVPISVKNSGSEKISVYIDVTSNDTDVLTVDMRKRPLLEIYPKQNNGLQIPMIAKASGDAVVSVQLRTANNLPYGKPVKLTIRTTGYTGIALVIVGAALAVMLAAVVTRILRRRSNKKPARTPRTRESESV